MGGTAAALGLGGYAAYRAIKKATKKDDDSSSATSASTSTSTSTSTSDSAAAGSSQTIYDGMLSEEAVANAKKKKASAGTMADEGEQTFGGGALGA